VDHDTAGFAVNAIRTWWDHVAREPVSAVSTPVVAHRGLRRSNGNRAAGVQVEVAAFGRRPAADQRVVISRPDQ